MIFLWYKHSAEGFDELRGLMPLRSRVAQHLICCIASDMTGTASKISGLYIEMI